ncbi:GNAT family N-acetyltransferase [Saccharothrix obliqua]|uniref:GNAT family N-acetyltransferase n=1 Tax=Saccharothrix obliqua TaxID=2861747 RepID=UPI001C5D725F|nr:hypothetical protein [Saccharothrix obliqua]MBW4718615.1 hypothetical protein [Saccharothrix obliqua]
MDDGERADVAAALAEVFGDDPVARWLFPDDGSRPGCLVEFFAATVDWTAAHGGVVMASPGYECVYTACPPGGEPTEDDVIDLPVLHARMDAIRTCSRLAEQRRRALPPHLYAIYGGVAAGARGRGLFKAALSQVVAWCDDRRTPFYGEATSARSAALYERAGFSRLEPPIALPDGPSLYPIWRDPRSSTGRGALSTGR